VHTFVPHIMVMGPAASDPLSAVVPPVPPPLLPPVPPLPAVPALPPFPALPAVPVLVPPVPPLAVEEESSPPQPVEVLPSRSDAEKTKNHAIGCFMEMSS